MKSRNSADAARREARATLKDSLTELKQAQCYDREEPVVTV